MENNILDFPSEPVKRPTNNVLKYLELTLVLSVVFGVFLRNVVNVNGGHQMILLSGVLLPLIYLVANWWLNSPAERTFRTISLTIFQGLALSSFAFTLVFFLLNLTGADQMFILSLIVSGVLLMIDFLTSIRTKMVVNRIAVIRFAALLVVTFLLFLMPESRRADFVSRRFYYQSQ